MPRAFALAYGYTDQHAKALAYGLRKLPSNFVGRICPLCDGYGEYYFRVCEHCDGGGLLQGHHAAPDSVLNQVLVAATRY